MRFLSIEISSSWENVGFNHISHQKGNLQQDLDEGVGDQSRVVSSKSIFSSTFVNARLFYVEEV